MDLINALQVLNAEEHLYFVGNEGQRVHQLHSRFMTDRPETENLEIRIEGDDGSLMLGNMKEYFRIPATWSFCKIRKGAPRDFRPRAPEMDRLHVAWQRDRTQTRRKISFLAFCAEAQAKTRADNL